jgi:NADPH:quinone reductase-like Zn-dependent oxidoreductase
MRAMSIDRFGGPEMLRMRTVPVPDIGEGEVLIRVETAGVGTWDSFERQGGYAELLGLEPKFPYLLGSEGAGTVAASRARAGSFREGDRVYALGFLNPKGGFYAEYAAVGAGLVSRIPGALTVEQAGAMGGVGVTALRGLDDVLALKKGESVMIFGAGGGVGHIAVQLAKRMGARVLAVASGADGAALAERLGADAAVDGRSQDIRAAARAFAPGGLDAALLTAGGPAAEEALAAVRDGGRAAFPKGVAPEPRGRADIRIDGYYGEVEPGIIQRFDRLAARGPFQVHIARVFPLARAAEAHRALDAHYLGKLVLRVA